MVHSVKQLLCIFLVLWFGLHANLMQVHATQEAAHDLTHVLNATSDMADDLDHDVPCAGSHCHHGTAITQSNLSAEYLAVRTPLRSVDAALISPLLPPEIERPKWALATHAVAGF
jgi:hypothetical protein